MGSPLTVVEAEKFAEIESREGEVEVHLRLEIPIYECSVQDLPESVRAKAEDDDVYIRGPVYVGNAEMLDRHRELVAPEALINSWPSYQKNPVILFNHRKDYGTIGRMLEVEMGDWEGLDFPVPIGYAQIDGGEDGIVRKIRKGFLRAFSIGFIAKAGIKECPDGGDEESCYITFTEIDWIETSVVDIPASPGALFNVEKMVVTKGWRKSEVEVENSTAGGSNFSKAGISSDMKVESSGGSAENPAEKHIIGYQDMGDRIAILFEKEPTDSSEVADEEVGDGELSIDEQEITELSTTCGSSAEQSAGLPCSCSTKQATGDTVPLNSPVSESDRLAKGGDTMTELEEPNETLEIEEPVIEAKEAHLPKPVEVLVQVVKELQTINERLDTQQKAHDEEVAELQAQITTLTHEATEANEKAAFEAEVAKRVADLIGDAPVEAAVEPAEEKEAPAPERKSSSTSQSLDQEIALETIGLDPHIKATAGGSGLKGWLEHQLATRGA